MRWPGRIPAGTTCPQIAGNIDVLPTFARLVGAELPSDRILDGRDITPLMFNAQAGPVRETHLYFTANQTLAAIRQGDWKLIMAPPTNRKADQPGQKGKDSFDLVLYNLANDPAEATNVAENNPQIVAKLRAEAQRSEAEIKEHRRPAGQIKDKD
jgi:arylsulfatase A-like enzyme